MTDDVYVRKVAERGGLRSGGVLRHARGHTDAVRIETFTLNNGLQVVILPMPRVPKVTYMVWYKVGAADDPAGKSGLAHLVEHATFRGVEAHAEQGAARRGAHHSPSEGDAFTSYDYTAYYHVVPIKRLETVLHTEADRMARLVVTHAALLLEQDEVVEERCAEVTSVPEARFDEHLRATLYGPHPYGVPVLGRPDEEQRLTAQDITTFYHTWYAPNNAILIVAGDVTATQLAPLLQRYYGSIPARPVPARHRLTAPRPQGGQRLVMQAPHVRKPLWKRIYLAPSYNAGDTRHVYALQVLVELLAEEQVGLRVNHLAWR
jgi:zinc protease